LVTLRTLQLNDAFALYRFRLDNEVIYWAAGGWYTDAVYTLRQLEDQIRDQQATEVNRTYAIEVKEQSGPIVIGTVSFRGLDPITLRVNLTIVIGDKRYWGMGHGTEAVRQFVVLLFNRYSVHRIDFDTFAENRRAIRCCEKNGFMVEGVKRKAMWTTEGYRDQVVMGILREDWIGS
jgi:RimJ/RimL family protein N-acetyltransferase